MSHPYLRCVAEEERQKRILVISRRLMRDTSDPMSLPPTDFRKKFRMTQIQFLHLCEELKPLLPLSIRRTSVRTELKILAAIAFYGNGSYQKSIGAYFHLGLSQPMVSRCVQEITQALNTPGILTKYIHFPDTDEQRDEVTRRFMELHNFPGVLGCIHGTHIAIVRPSENEEAYFNRKLYHSINALIICDGDLQILHVDASAGGASHDSHVWRLCSIQPLMQQLTDEGRSYWLLRDSGYAQVGHLMTPVLNAAPGSPEEHYTQRHVRTRNVVERCIGVLKARWRCLLAHRVLHYSPVKAGKIINACVVLHNMMRRDALTFHDSDNDFPQQIATNDAGSTENIRERVAVIERLWQMRHGHASSDL